MVTDIVHSDGEDIPAPTFAVYPDTSELYKSKVDDCVRDFKDGKQSVYLSNGSYGPSCIESLEDQANGPIEMGLGVKTWRRVFNLNTGWFYTRSGRLTMKEALKDPQNHLYAFAPLKSKFQVMIYDNNDFTFGETYNKLHD